MRSLSTIAVNGSAFRKLRIARGWTQMHLAKLAGYSERLIRKAELGGSLRQSVLADLAATLATVDSPVTVETLSVNPLKVAQLWMESFDRYGVNMLEHLRDYLTEDFVFHCSGNEATFPFNGTFHGIAGHQQWLDAFFGCFVRHQGIDVRYTVSPDSATARWMETVSLHGIQCPPVRVNLHFFFKAGLLCRIEDDYDTQAGADIQAAILEHLGQNESQVPPLSPEAWRPGSNDTPPPPDKPQ